jgi:hypothetical protein
MKGGKLLLTIIVVLISIFAIGIIVNKAIVGNAIAKNVDLDAYKDMRTVLAQNKIIQNLPENGVIYLRFYNFDSGKRQWERSYKVTKGNLKDILTAPISYDSLVIIHSKYVKEFTGTNFCEIVKKAKDNGDLGVDLKISKLSFMWKYRSVLNEYKNCFGL